MDHFVKEHMTIFDALFVPDIHGHINTCSVVVCRLVCGVIEFC